MELHPDFKDLLQAFAEEKVEYLVIGGYAVAFHAQPRYTKDIDLWVADSTENLQRVHAALSMFGAPEHILSALQSAGPEEIVWLGAPPVRVDILKTVPGMSFAAAYPNRLNTHWGDVPVVIVGKQDLIVLKEAAGRPQDLIDVSWLRKASP